MAESTSSEDSSHNDNEKIEIHLTEENHNFNELQSSTSEDNNDDNGIELVLCNEDNNPESTNNEDIESRKSEKKSHKEEDQEILLNEWDDANSIVRDDHYYAGGWGNTTTTTNSGGDASYMNTNDLDEYRPNAPVSEGYPITSLSPSYSVFSPVVMSSASMRNQLIIPISPPEAIVSVDYHNAVDINTFYNNVNSPTSQQPFSAKSPTPFDEVVFPTSGPNSNDNLDGLP